MMSVSERRVCRVLGQHRSTQRKTPRGADDEAALTEDIIALARQYGRYGYRRVTALLRDAGWHVNRKRVERIWRREGLKVPQKQPKRWACQEFCARGRLSSLDDEPFAEDHGELGFCFGPFARRSFPLLRRMIEDEV